MRKILSYFFLAGMLVFPFMPMLHAEWELSRGLNEKESHTIWIQKETSEEMMMEFEIMGECHHTMHTKTDSEQQIHSTTASHSSHIGECFKTATEIGIPSIDTTRIQTILFYSIPLSYFSSFEEFGKEILVYNRNHSPPIDNSKVVFLREIRRRI